MVYYEIYLCIIMIVIDIWRNKTIDLRVKNFKKLYKFFLINIFIYFVDILSSNTFSILNLCFVILQHIIGKYVIAI